MERLVGSRNEKIIMNTDVKEMAFDGRLRKTMKYLRTQRY
jgi:hypothetical protein